MCNDATAPEPPEPVPPNPVPVIVMEETWELTPQGEALADEIIQREARGQS